MRRIIYGVLVMVGLVAAVAGGWYAGRQSVLATHGDQAVMGRAAAIVTVNGHPLYDREMLMVAPPAHDHHGRMMHDEHWKYAAVAGVKSFVRDTLVTTAVGILLLALLVWLRRPAAGGTSDPPGGA